MWPILALGGLLRNAGDGSRRGSQRQDSSQAKKSCGPRTDSGASGLPSINFLTYRSP